jgi:hypothetical protein
MRCKHLGRDNLCMGKYAGYACIKKQCSSYKEAQRCEFHESNGDYCRKYARFGCVGRDSCATLTDYLEAVAEEELS